MTARLFVGTRKGLFVWSRRASGWEIEAVHFLGDPVTMVLPAWNGTLYATLTLGHFGSKLRRLKSGESEWTELASPVYPEGAMVNAGPPRADGTAPQKPASLSEIWSLEAVGPAAPATLWAGTIPGALFRSDDEGQSWQLIEPLWNAPERQKWFGGGKDDPGIHSIVIDPRDPQTVTLGISCGGVWRTQDGGATWENIGQGLRAEFMPPELQYDKTIQDPHRLVACRTSPDTMWVQHHNGVFLSRDGGNTFTELTTPKPSVFGFAVVAHPQEADVAWFAPATKDEKRYPVDARVVASRTRDGGQSFDVLTQGLPQQHAYDLVYRHAMDVDPSGDILAMGSTTGGLWVSEDQGDQWTCLSSHLPPIYVTRFDEAV